MSRSPRTIRFPRSLSWALSEGCKTDPRFLDVRLSETICSCVKQLLQWPPGLGSAELKDMQSLRVSIKVRPKGEVQPMFR